MRETSQKKKLPFPVLPFPSAHLLLKLYAICLRHRNLLVSAVFILNTDWACYKLWFHSITIFVYLVLLFAPSSLTLRFISLSVAVFASQASGSLRFPSGANRRTSFYYRLDLEQENIRREERGVSCVLGSGIGLKPKQFLVPKHSTLPPNQASRTFRIISDRPSVPPPL